MKELIFSATKKDFRVETFCTGGPGGQNQNRKKNGVRITHIKTGLSSESREMKSQGQNKKRAFRRLTRLLVQHVRESMAKKSPTSEETIRTYHEPDNRVNDHASGEKRTYREVVDAGDESGLIAARRKAL